MPSINLMGSTNEGLSVNINDQENLNCYLVKNYNSRSMAAIVGAMGSVQFSNSTIGAGRGSYPKQIGDFAYFVAGSSLWRISSAGAQTAVGTVLGSSRVSVVFDGTSLIIFNGTAIAYYYNTDSGTFSTVALPANAYTGTTLDTYVVFSSDNQRFYVSNVGDSDTWDVLDFAATNKSPGDLIAVWEDHSELVLFCSDHIEPWFNGGDVDFTFAQNTAGIIERGTAARFSIAKEDNTLFFLGDDLVVYRMQGYQPVRVSNDGIETIISNIKRDSPSVIEEAFAVFYIEHGHKFYQLTFPGVKTLCFNVATNEWHTLKHWSLETHHATAYCYAFDKHLVSTVNIIGGVFELSRNYYSDGSSPLERLRRTQIISSNDRLLKWKKLKFILEFGTTSLLTGQGSEPQLILKWSDDFGRTYGNERYLTLGQTGDFLAKAIKRNCGASRARVFELSITDPVPFILIDAIADIT